ncbi:spleen trypsin inhibitor I-like isoform X2 [Moschus berezovskii]|uniref:spleen trypsin inhibitor I-like isoform X2 n=1 Tax=Moschus berezovskii TaxID=68408 RepID=UPI002443E9C9|nr:spleen trypsin inhibitor I-like isoform X2 [Moschus berezovskii]
MHAEAGEDIKSSVHSQHPQEPSCKATTKMNRLCLFAAFFFLLVILVDSTPGYEQHTQDQGYGITCGRRNEKHSASRPAFCLKPKIIGPCKGKKIRYFYDAKTGHCQHFFYGGCKGNLNNFYTMAQCMKTCCHAAGSRKGHGKSHPPKL